MKKIIIKQSVLFFLLAGMLVFGNTADEKIKIQIRKKRKSQL